MKWLYIFLTFWLTILIVGLFLINQVPAVTKPNWGVSFTASQAEWLGLPWQEVYTAILDDLKVKNIRLQANWNDIETAPGVYDFSKIDWQIAEAEKRGVEVTLAVGRKLPRWPECHEPSFVASLPVWDRNKAALKMLEDFVNHFKSYNTIKRWQLENEPLFVFGDCPKPNKHLLKMEANLLRSLDSRPILITDSGELSMWWETAGLADIQGVTMYQITWNPVYGYGSYPVPAWIYRLKAGLISQAVDYTIVSELQMEPWGPVSINQMDLSLASESFNADRFKDNIDFYKKTQLREAYLWGVEWWYKARTLGDDSMWLEAKKLFAE